MNREDAGQAATTNCWRVTGWSIAALVLLLPLAAMQVTREVDWTASDFVFAGMLIGSAGLVIELTFRRHSHRSSRMGAALLTATSLALIWIDAAVGIINDDHATLNLIYPGIVILALVVAAVGRFRTVALARGSAGAAAMLAVTGVIAVIASDPAFAASVVAFHLTFVVAFLTAAALFHRVGAAER
ncbi:hypothetical protein [Sphingomonas radiodurans]|uniref:hypothetical protein n=1 Tax=Sphingomonas radiodurans TaxID=2890321 RepID=UPI001E3363C4|nr:hypothetical protein [Sphingomonas radiodurans]WBH15848.1 hypothetical protein LLW23_13685 [Sphingomonas radiodurans]